MKVNIKKFTIEDKELFEKAKEIKKDNLDLLNQSIDYLEKNQIVNAKLEAELIFSHVLKFNRMLLALSFNREITDEEKISILVEEHFQKGGK